MEELFEEFGGIKRVSCKDLVFLDCHLYSLSSLVVVTTHTFSAMDQLLKCRP